MTAKQHSGRNILLFLVVLLVASGFFILRQEDSQSKVEGYFAYVANTEDGTITVIDTTLDEPLKVIEVDESVSDGLAASMSQRRIYVGNGNQGVLSVIDGDSGQVVEEINLERRIHGIDLSPEGRFLYLTSGALEENEEYNYIMVYDTHTKSQAGEILSGSNSPSHISFNSDGTLAFATNVMSGDLSVIDTASQEIIRTIPVGQVPNEGKTDPAGERFFVASLMENELRVIDLASGDEIARLPAGEGTHGVAVAEDGGSVWTANRFSGDVTVFDAQNYRLLATIEIKGMPNHVFQVPDMDKMYVSSLESNEIAVIDMNSLEVIKRIPVGSKPHEIGFIPK
ncbi:MAG: cytochrome D1 domain-containing protein [Bacillota bacterium]|nr:cytochrome D1 domain-containing protein [Bacillota bacterium]MDW7677915.1 cytochrome D1 domain-containing protein [Bacillota bacterium]